MTQRNLESAPEWVFTAGAAAILGLSEEAVVRMADAGEVPCWRATPTARRRFNPDVLRRIRAQADEAAGVTVRAV